MYATNVCFVCRDLYGVMSGMAYISCILMLMYATDSTYRLSYFISANLLTIAIPLTLLVTIVTLTNNKQLPQVWLATHMHTHVHAHAHAHTHTCTHTRAHPQQRNSYLNWRNQSIWSESKVPDVLKEKFNKKTSNLKPFHCINPERHSPYIWLTELAYRPFTQKYYFITEITCLNPHSCLK